MTTSSKGCKFHVGVSWPGKHFSKFSVSLSIWTSKSYMAHLGLTANHHKFYYFINQYLWGLFPLSQDNNFSYSGQSCMHWYLANLDWSVNAAKNFLWSILVHLAILTANFCIFVANFGLSKTFIWNSLEEELKNKSLWNQFYIGWIKPKK